MTQQAVLEYIVNSIWQVPMLAAMAWLLVWLGKPGVRTQHFIWLLTLALSILLPVAARNNFSAAPSPVTGTQLADIQPVPVANTAGRPNRSELPRFVAPRNHIAFAPLQTRTLRLSQNAVDWLILLYLIVVLVRVMQIIFSWRAAKRLLRNAWQGKLSPAVDARLKECCAKFQVREPRVLTSDEIASPMTIGGIEPTILLPEIFNDGTAGEMLAILCHELAHIQRRDYLANWICQLASLPIAYHPATHGVQRRIRQSRERVCDAMAADAMRSTTGYARCLVTLAQRMLEGNESAQQVPGLGLFDHDVLEERIMQLLEKKTRMSVRAKILRVGGGMVLVGAVITMAAIFHVTPTVVNAAVRNASAVQIATPAQVASPADMATPAEVAMPARVATSAGEPVAVKRSVALRVTVPVRVAVPIQAVVPVHFAVPVRVVAPVRVTTAVPVVAPVQLAIAVQATTPVPATTPISQTPAPKVAPVPTVKPAPDAHISAEGNPHRTATPQNEQYDLTPEQRARMEADMAAARAQMREATKNLQSPEFKRQMAEMQRQVQQATRQLRSEEVQRQMEMLQSPEFKRQMAEMQRQVQQATRQLQSEEVQRQMKMLQSPEFKKRMAEMQAQMKDLNSATMQWRMEMQNSPEFKRQMAEMQRKIKEATKQLQNNSVRVDGNEANPSSSGQTAQPDKTTPEPQ